MTASGHAHGGFGGPEALAWRPVTGRVAGEPLWGAPRRRQPILPLAALALVTILVAAPSAFSGRGERSSNPITLMHSIAATTYQLTGLVDGANETLTRIDANVKPLADLGETMTGIAGATQDMAKKTDELDAKLASVSTSVGQSKSGLQSVNDRLGGVSGGMSELRGAVEGSTRSTQQIVTQFGSIRSSIDGMDTALRSTITLLGSSSPQTKLFAENRTVKAVAGGSGTKYQVPNITAGSRVMSVVIPMIDTMQKGGPLPARKDSAKASNPLVGTLLKMQVPDGTNVFAHIRPYDGFYGMPPPQYFVNNRVAGF